MNRDERIAVCDGVETKVTSINEILSSPYFGESEYRIVESGSGFAVVHDDAVWLYDFTGERGEEDRPIYVCAFIEGDHAKSIVNEMNEINGLRAKL